MQFFTYFPYSAPITALLRNGFGNLPIWQAAIVIVELFALTAVALRLAAHIFQTGPIAYSNRVNLRTALVRPRYRQNEDTPSSRSRAGAGSS